MSDKIFTLDARGNMIFETMRDYFRIPESTMRSVILKSFVEMQAILESKGIEYKKLKGALVPSTDRLEVALVFDTNRIETNSYGHEVFERLLPSLDSDSVSSFLCGDMSDIGNTSHQDLLYRVFCEQVQLIRSCDWQHSSQFFIVYINNLTRRRLLRICEVLASYEGYVGWVDCFSPSLLKTYFSMILAHAFVKIGRVIIQGHEDDRHANDNVNMLGYPFEQFGCECKSIPSMYFGPFLGFKIERKVFQGFESDTLLSLNSISASVVPLDQCTVAIEEGKLRYLQSEKRESMKRSGLLAVNQEELQGMIKERLLENYVFNMEFLEKHNVMKFNTILNFIANDGETPFKVLASLEYKPSEKCVRLITMY